MYRRPNHVLHAIVSVLTGGLWLVPWAVIAWRDGRRRHIEAEIAAELNARRAG